MMTNRIYVKKNVFSLWPKFANANVREYWVYLVGMLLSVKLSKTGDSLHKAFYE